MVGIERTPACPTKGCPWPDDYPHTPWCLHIRVEHWPSNPTHQHWPKKGMGGNNPDSKIVAILCETCHDAVDNGFKWGNGVFPDKDGVEHYLLWDIAKGIENPLIDRTLEAGSAAAEPGHGSEKTQRTGLTMKKPLGQSLGPTEGSVAAPSASGEDSAGEGDGAGVSYQPVSLDRNQPSSPSPAPFSLETWKVQGAGLLEMEETIWNAAQAIQFAKGDWFLDGEQHLAEEVYGHLDSIHSPSGKTFKPRTLMQYIWVAKNVAPDTRVAGLDWTYHRAVAALPEPKQKEWLKRAQEENLSSKDLNQAIHGKRTTVKRWSLEELRVFLSQFEAEAFSPKGKDYWTPPEFLDWLEAK